MKQITITIPDNCELKQLTVNHRVLGSSPIRTV